MWKNGAAALLLLAIPGASAWTAPPRPSPPGNTPTTAQIAKGYAQFHLLTPRPVLVDPEFAMLCAGASPAQVRAARVDHGPHAHAAIKVFMNDLADEAFRARARKFPEGSVVVKEKHFFAVRGVRAAGPAPSGVGGMVKRGKGYDPEHGDWEYFYFEDPATIESGRIASCVDCHASAKSSDHVFGSWLSAPGGR